MQFRPTLVNCFSRILLTSTPFLPGQWQMSARQEVLRIGGSSHLSHLPTGSNSPQYITAIWNLSPRSLGWLGGLSSVAMATPANLPCSRRFHKESERHLSRAPPKSNMPLLRVCNETKLTSIRSPCDLEDPDMEANREAALEIVSLALDTVTPFLIDHMTWSTASSRVSSTQYWLLFCFRIRLVSSCRRCVMRLRRSKASRCRAVRRSRVGGMMQ